MAYILQRTKLWRQNKRKSRGFSQDVAMDGKGWPEICGAASVFPAIQRGCGNI